MNVDSRYEKVWQDIDRRGLAARMQEKRSSEACQNIKFLPALVT